MSAFVRVPDGFPWPIEDQIKCCVRELAFRERVYPRWVKDKKMRQEEADKQLSLMRAVIRSLETLKVEQCPRCGWLGSAADLLDRESCPKCMLVLPGRSNVAKGVKP